MGVWGDGKLVISQSADNQESFYTWNYACWRMGHVINFGDKFKKYF